MKRLPSLIAPVVAVAISLAACGGSLKVQPVTVEPIHVTVDVNLHDHADAQADAPIKK